jgi:magnesium transporter
MEHAETHTKTLKDRYPEATAGWHMVSRIPVARAEDVAGDVLDRLKGKDWDTINYIYVVDDERVIKGVVSLNQIFAAEPSTLLERLMKNEVVTVTTEADQEEVAVLAVQHQKKAIPVVDKRNRLLGVVPPHCILDIMHQEHMEDLLRLVGVRNHASLVERPLQLIKARLPWLFLGLIFGLAGTSIVSLFESALREELALAFFVPLIVYMADAVGTQTETIFIRSLSQGMISRTSSVSSYVWKEIMVGLSMGIVLGILSLLSVSLVWGNINLALIIAVSMFATISSAVIIAVFIPWLLFKMKTDPAYGSGPFATAIQDIVSLVFYFVIASMFMRL